MRLIIRAFVMLPLLVAASRAEPPDAKAILQQAQEATRAVSSVRYEVSGQAQGTLAGRLPSGSGTVTQVTVPGTDLPKLRLDARVTPPQTTEQVTLWIACDGTFVTLAEHGHKIFLRKALPAGAALLNSVSGLLMREFGRPNALEQEARAVSLEYIGSEKVGDVECDVLRAVYADDGGEARWWFGKTDHLPRRVRRTLETPAGNASLTTTVLALRLNPEIREGLFTFEKPAGFEDPTASGLLSVGSPAPDWTLKTPDGKKVSLKGLRGKVVLLDFWATWCGPCQMAMPGVQRLHERYKGKPVAVYGVNCWQERESRKLDPAEFMKTRKFTYPILLKGNSVARAYKVAGIPAFYLIGPEGKIMYASAGYSPSAEQVIDDMVQAALAKLK